MQVQFDFDSRDVYDTFLKPNRDLEACCGVNREFLPGTTDLVVLVSVSRTQFLSLAIAPSLKPDSTEYTLELKLFLL